VAGLLGILGGLFLSRAFTESKPALLEASRWSGPGYDLTRERVVAGSFADDPQRGVVLLQDGTSEPRLFSMPTRSGPLRVVAGSAGDWILETPDGRRAVLDRIGDAGATFNVLGPRLDPEHLPAIAPEGVAVPVVYGRSRLRAVLLVGFDARRQTFELYGYLPRYVLPSAATADAKLARPLLGADGRLYSIDAPARRLVRTGGAATPEQKVTPPDQPCTTWPAEDGRYVACPRSIALVHPNGVRETLARPPYSGAYWLFLAPSPNGRTLLLEQDIFGCGLGQNAYFLPARGGTLSKAVADPRVQSAALGWLRDGTALVAVRDGECEGALHSGIYRERPGRPWDELVLETTSDDATVWGPLAG